MANYHSQNPYGLNFVPTAPAHAVPSPAHGAQGRQAAAAAAAAFQFNAGIPGLDATKSYWQLHSAPFPFPPPPPPHMVQNGFPLPAPPPFPGFNPSFASSTAPSTAITTAVQSPSNQQFSLPQPIPVHNRIMEIADTEREDGEVSDGEGSISQSTRTSDTTHSMVRNSHNNSPRIPGINMMEPSSLQSEPKGVDTAQLRKQQMPSINIPLNNGVDSRPRIATEPKQNSVHQFRQSGPHKPSITERAKNMTLSEQRELAKEIISSIYEHTSFVQLAQEGLDPGLLSQLYKDCGLTIPVENPHLLQSETTHSTGTSAHRGSGKKQNTEQNRPSSVQISTSSPANGIATTAKPSVDKLTDLKTSATAPSLSSKSLPTKAVASPVDRQQYIARLMAAKSGKSTAPISPSTEQPSQNSSKSIDTLTPATNTPIIQSIPSHPPAVSQAVDKKRIQTELARQRIQELASKRQMTQSVKATKLNESPIDTPTTIFSPYPGPVALQARTNNISATNEDINSLRSSPTQSLHDGQKSSGPVSSDGRDDTASSGERKDVPASAIPGLFMTSSPVLQTQSRPILQIPSTSPIIKLQTSHSVIQPRKRPVASDFDEAPHVPSTSVKRTFGQSRHDQMDEQMIIEVSDDESSGSVMDIDEGESPTIILTAPAQSMANTLPVPRLASKMSDLPQKPTFPRQTSSIPTSATSTPTIQTPGALDVDQLKRHEEEIEKLKRKIAEAELRKRVKLQHSRAQTPATPKRPTVPTQTSQTSLEHKADFNPQSPISAQDVQIAAPTSLPSSSNPSNSDVPDVSTPVSPEWKKRRRAEIESGLPTIEANMVSAKMRMEELRQEMERLQAETLRQSLNREKLVEELESLDIGPNHVLSEEEQTRTDETYNDIEKDAVSTMTEASISTPSEQSDPVEKSPQPIEDETMDAELIFIQPPKAPAADPELSKPVIPAIDVPPEDSSDISGDEMDMSDAESEVAEITQCQSTSLVTAVAPVAANIDIPQSGPPNPSINSTPDVPSPDRDETSDDFYSPEPTELPSIEGKNESDSIAQPNSATEAGSEAQSIEIPTTESISCRGTPMSESPEIPAVNIVQPEKLENAATAEYEMDYDPSDYLPGLSRPVQSEQIHVASVTTSRNNSQTPIVESNPTIADDLSSGLQSATESVVNGEDLQAVAIHSAKSFFTPYESPLRLFKSYRYHPEFTQAVSGGYRSMTYSNQIDPAKPLCRYEAAGGTCNDAECEEQHFRAMGLSDDKILVQLGTMNPGRTDEEKQQFTEGLRQVLKDLRSRNAKDANVVATEIANYRRGFLKDPTRVLAL